MSKKTKSNPFCGIPRDGVCEVIRVIPPGRQILAEHVESQLALFDQATERHSRRASAHAVQGHVGRGWSREGLYRRGRSR